MTEPWLNIRLRVRFKDIPTSYNFQESGDIINYKLFQMPLGKLHFT